MTKILDLVEATPTASLIYMCPLVLYNILGDPMSNALLTRKANPYSEYMSMHVRTPDLTRMQGAQYNKFATKYSVGFL